MMFFNLGFVETLQIISQGFKIGHLPELELAEEEVLATRIERRLRVVAEEVHKLLERVVVPVNDNLIVASPCNWV